MCKFFRIAQLENLGNVRQMPSLAPQQCIFTLMCLDSSRPPAKHGNGLFHMGISDV